MKFIHLSDLHLGKRLNEISMLKDQEYILLQILQIIDAEQPEAVLISGDVYDKSIPSAEAVTLFDDFLCRLAKRKLHTFLISGNHDSAERLAFGNRLLQSSGIHISPVYRGNLSPVTLEDRFGAVHFWLLPFLKPVQLRQLFPEETIETYTDACAAAVAHMDLDKNARNVLLTHQFVTGAATCNSEEISVGGTDNVDAAVFADFDYVALGHIHSPQNIGSNRIRYCGTPLKYSFSEAAHHKSVTVVELGEKGEVHVTLVPLSPKHDLREIRGSFGELTDKAYYEGTATDDYLHILLTDEEDIPEASSRLRVIYPNLIQLSYDNTRTRTTQVVNCAQDVKRKSPLELFDELYQKQNNQPMSDVQRGFLLELMDTLEEENQ